ncbi:MAG: hypothetical protein FD161_382 [Limisphaerales bacterium]|nr:MAG: hypothetical protein FD161_382 [Limisphaerales bacterium]KAG0510828.1 MAG: hypothetical protein E1N63_382 [Limisphaerales bacterium]TXT48954.1 MAG: hypothetical protein FD140_3336 [Limisphaerales bacterium]
MKHLNRLLSGVTALLAFAAVARGQSLSDVPSALLHVTTNDFQRGVNLQSQRGVPLSGTVGTPAGSDGRIPLGQPTATPGQFQGIVSYGAVTVAANPAALGAGSFAANADAIDFPRAKDGATVKLILRAQAGAYWVSQESSLLFGAVVPPPDTDLDGNTLTGAALTSYWAAEPFSTNNHAGAAYYYSPHAGKVFAIQPGDVRVVWRRSAALAGQPADFAGNENVKYAFLGGLYYQLLPTQQTASEGAVKLTRKLYWTEGIFLTTGQRVAVPPAVVKDLRFGYNATFPQYVASNEVFAASGSSSPLGTNSVLLDTRTVWAENGYINANNKEGRLFVELLGNSLTNGAREHLGYELVDVTREPLVEDVTTELGERLTAYPNNSPSDASLRPAPIINLTGPNYVYQRYVGTDGALELYATRVTPELNSSKAHWLEQGIAGLWWPARFVRYKQVWPADVARYSHYVRPTVSDEPSAQATAVTVPVENSPTIEYEDPSDIIRSKLTADLKFYTYLDSSHPALRTLIRYTSGDRVAFERVFSWLDVNLRTTNFAGSVATELSAWNAGSGAFNFTDPVKAPRVVNTTAWVGQRLTAPAGEATTITIAPDGEPAANATAVYLAGFVRTNQGTGFSVTAYKDPFVNGFSEASSGAIIPITASNNNANLEVWWYRGNQPDEVNGFVKTYWPSTIARHTVLWPTNHPLAREIILASNAGSEALTSLEAKGALYFQNDPGQPGYNPNEEHALLQGGQAWALRDDLNVTNSAGYSSHPYVLLEYTDADGRPSMTAFRVLREKDSVVFDYTRSAGTILQAPMPLPLLERPLGSKIIGTPPRSLNAEVKNEIVSAAAITEADGISHATITTTRRHFFQPYELLALQNVSPLTTKWFYGTNATGTSAQLGGVVSAARPVALGIWTASAQPGDLTKYRFRVTTAAGLAANAPVLLANATLRTNWLATIAATGTVSGDTFVEIQFTGNAPADTQSGAVLVVPESGLAGGAFTAWRLAYEPLPEAIADAAARDRFASFTYQDRKGDVWFYRGPHQPGANGKMVMQFYYKTLEGFYFPSLPFASQPAVGIITPYLRSRNPDGTFVGDAIYGDLNGDNTGDGNSLGIAYRPVWPESTPVLMMAESLTLPKRGLPSVRGQTSINLLYQQPQVTGGLTVRAAVLHDPTREKQFKLPAKNTAGALNRLPDSLRTSAYQGLTFFPNLPPHLVERFFYDPNRGVNGALVLRGQFKQEVVGDNYLLLNVLGPQDAEALRGLCIGSDPLKSYWDSAINSGLVATMEKFVEDPGRPGTFKVGGSETVGPGVLAEAKDQDVAVDSYALTATGPGVGYVTMVMGDGFAFTPTAEPVSVQIIQVVDTLYPGQLKIVKPSNPLSEMLTLQQVVDLGGKTDDFDFEWLIAAPVQGVPPTVYQNTRRLLLGDGTWSHLRFPLATDQPATVHFTDPARVVAEVTTAVTPVALVPFVTVATNDDKLSFVLTPGQRHTMTVGAPLIVRSPAGSEFTATVTSVTGTTYQSQPATNLVVALDADQENVPASLAVLQLYERSVAGQPQSIVFREFTVSEGSDYSQFFLSLDLDATLGAKVYLDGQLVAVANTGVGDTDLAIAPGGFTPLAKVYQLNPDRFSGGTRSGGVATHRIAVELFSGALPGSQLSFNLRLEAYESVDQTSLPGTQWLALDASKFRDKVRAILGTGADVRALSDNYLIARYRATNTTHASFAKGFSRWTEPQLAEGWIKRVLAGINPFNQRVTDLFNNSVNTDVSILTQAGKRWEGDVALNLESINSYGLIEIYETVLRRGRNISIDSGINYGPANDALLLAASYLNDLYMMLGNEAWADSSNPTIGVGTKENDVATALFAFKGQVATLLEEELALLRGRDDFLQPGVQARPVYNRMFWNYTRGIDAGEVIYALNYNIKPLAGSAAIDAAAAAKMYPQGHGDAYGHYLTAVKQFTELFISPNFDWVPHSEAVTVLGQPVQVNYQNERKFAAAASSLARAGSQILDLTWRKDYVPGGDVGWESLSVTATNTTRDVPTTRHWGVDQWASRTMQAAYFTWAMGNSILPAVDPDPTHEGIQKVDRTTVPELLELPETAQGIQLTLDNAEAHATPLGLSAGSLAFDINPNLVVGAANSQTHFEQIYERARKALNNAVISFDDAKDVTRQLRSEQDTLAEVQAAVTRQEQAYTNQLIELYGTPYPDDIGPGKSFDTGYTGPDLFHFAYVDRPDMGFRGNLQPTQTKTYEIDYSQRTFSAADFSIGDILKFALAYFSTRNVELAFVKGSVRTVKFTLDPDGFYQKPSDWTGKRQSPGQIQDAVAKVITARNNVAAALEANDAESLRFDLLMTQLSDRYKENTLAHKFDKKVSIDELKKAAKNAANELKKATTKTVQKTTEKLTDAAATAPPTSLIAGVAAGGDATSSIRSVTKGSTAAAEAAKDTAINASDSVQKLQEIKNTTESNLVYHAQLVPLRLKIANAALMNDTKLALRKMDATLYEINRRVVEYDQAVNSYRALVARGQRVLSEREIFRQRTATVVQGYRTRDAAFRIFRDEKLERYKTLFELAAKYTYLAANAYDYETGLLNTTKGKTFVNRIVNSRALGIVKSGEPQYAGSNTGDPGLSSVLAEMRADWDVLRGRLGFNNPTPYGTTVSLRTENLRIVNGAEGDTTWKDALSQSRKANLLDDPDVTRYCMQIDPGNGLPVPGLVVEFSTTVTDSLNLFGRELAGGDHYYDSSYFATKIFSVGVALEGYVGMDNPSANGSTVSSSGGTSPSDPSTTFLDPLALAATPGIYLIPVGADAMRSPPLGDVSTIRSWTVNDITIPLPFNIGGSEFSTKPLYTSSDSLTEPLFGLRKHAAFRPVSKTSVFTGSLTQSQFTNTRLIGRSVWNTRWKLVIPGYKLLHDPNEGLDRFVNTVKDIKLHYVTYSYSGN